MAARVRVIFAGFSDDPAEERQAFLADEIERAMGEVPPSRRTEYLETLGAHFPRWQPASVNPAAGTVEAPLGAGPLLDQLLARFAELSEGDRQRLLEKIRSISGGAITVGDAGHYQEIWKRLGVDASATPSHERVWRLLGGLLDFFFSLDQLGWTLWRNMGIKSAYWKESDLAKLAGPYLAGNHEVSSDQTKLTIERTRRLIAAIVGAPGRAAADVANQQAAQFSPENIEVAARSEKRALESLDAACWREYKQRYASNGTPPHLEAAIQKALAQAAEDLIGGRTR